MGWITVCIVIGSQLLAAFWLVRNGARRWRDYLFILLLTAVLVRPVLKVATGDISAWLPYGWSDGADGKDQIILASTGSTILLPLVLAAGLVWAANRVSSSRLRRVR